MGKRIIKVCGMRETENIQAVATLGIQLMGFIFYAKSSRYVGNASLAFAPQMTANRPKRVGVFVNESVATIAALVAKHQLDYVQLHGNETATFVEMLRTSLPVDTGIIKALSVETADDIQRWREYQGLVNLLLFDTRCTTYGGSGTQFDWQVLQAYDGDIPFLLSGGIGPADAARVKAFHHPRCVGIDLNSRFEISAGLKDVALLKQFINELKST